MNSHSYAFKIASVLALACLALGLMPGASQAAAAVTPTNEWVNFYSQASYLDGQLLPVGAQVIAYNPRGVEAGSFTVTHAGWYGLMPVYRDDPNTAPDEGLRPGEMVTFKINGITARTDGPDDTVWNANGALKQVNLIASSLTPTNEWVNFYSQNSTLNSGPLTVGALVQAFDPQGVLCGESIVSHGGWYGLLSCYGDDAATPVDEGAVPGDAISFKVNGYAATVSGPDPATWNQNGGLRQVDLAVSVPVQTACFALTLTHTGSGGDPTAAPANSQGCTAGQYVSGENITLTATPASGSSVATWSGTDNDASTSTTNTLTMPPAAVMVTVNYALIPPVCYALTLAHTGSGTDPIANPTQSSGCSVNQFVAGEVISLTASPASSYSVASWWGTNQDSSAATTNTLTMPAAAHTAGVNYTLNPPVCYTLTLMHTGSGSNPTANPVQSSGCQSGKYVVGESITLTASPASGNHVASWIGTNNDTSTAGTNTVTMPASARTVTVNYQPDSKKYWTFIPKVTK